MNKTSVPFSGAFIFKPAGHDIFYCTYINTVTPIPFPEISKHKINSNREKGDAFIGTLDTQWMETGPEKISAELSILQHPNGFAGVYNLHWRNIDPQSSTEYRGLGMLQGDDMVGSYWKVM